MTIDQVLALEKALYQNYSPKQVEVLSRGQIVTHDPKIFHEISNFVENWKKDNGIDS